MSREEDEDQGAGDQGMMFGYATNETDNYMPVSLDLAQLIMKELAAIRKEGKVMTYLRPDSKSQVTVEYSDDNIPQRIDTIVVSTQHDDLSRMQWVMMMTMLCWLRFVRMLSTFSSHA